MPKISETVIETVKANSSLLSLLNDYNLSATKKGSSHFTTCPFHDVDGHEEKTPSLSIDPDKNLYHCFSCEAKGNVIQFVQAMDKITFPDAVNKLLTVSNQQLATPSAVKKEKLSQPKPTISDEERESILSSFVAKASEELRNSKVGREYLEKRGLPVLDLLNSFTIGYCPTDLFKNLVSSERKKLELAGLMMYGKPLFENCVIFPLIKDGKITTIYGRNITGGHYMLPAPRAGLYLPKQGLNPQKPVIITECIIDTLSLFAAGVTNTIPLLGTNGFLEDHQDYLKAQNFPTIYTALDGDEAGRRASASLVEKVKAENINLPDDEDLNTMLVDYGANNLKKWIVEKIRKELPRPTTTEENGFIFIQFENRVYRIQGLSTVGMDRLKVTMKLFTTDEPTNFHMDSVDLYQSRSRERLITDATNIFRVKQPILTAEINLIITTLEEKRIANTASSAEKRTYQMSESEKAEALKFLTAPNLMDRIADQFTNSGMVGNRTESVLAYLGSLSRLTDKPFGVLIVSRSGAGKSFLQEMVGSFVPKEFLLRMTRLTGQSLFYQGREGLKHKLLNIEEDEGMQDAMYSIRTLLSSQRLSLHSLKADQKSGDLKAYENVVEGPASVMISTTDLSRFDFESVNRFLVLFLDESEEQTTEILKRTATMSGETKIKMSLQKKQIQKLQQNVQRLIEPITVVNSLGTGVNYPTHILNTRREQNKLSSLIEVIALLHQHQREIKTAEFFGVKTRYIEVQQSDIDIALSLASVTLQQSLDELSPLGRKLLNDMSDLVNSRYKIEKKSNPNLQRWSVSFTRREMQDRNNWSVWHLRQHCAELVESGFITPRNGRKGQLYSYSLVVDTIPEMPKILVTSKD